MRGLLVRTSLAAALLPCCVAPDPPDPPDVAVRERLLATPSGTLFVRTGGIGPDVVLLHGLGDSSLGWHKLEQPLRDAGFRVTVWDALGTGRSERPDPGEYGLAAHVARLADVCDQLGIQRAHFVGNSLGGTVALLFAQLHPQRTGRLLLVSPAAYPEGGTTPQWFWRVPGLAESVLEQLPPLWVARSMLLFLYGDPRRVTATDVRAYAAFAATSDPMRGLILQERQLYPEAAVLARWVEGHKTVAAPARILWGTKDRVLPIQHAHRLAADLPAGELQLLGGVGHVAQLEVPEVVLAEAVAFLRRP